MASLGDTAISLHILQPPPEVAGGGFGKGKIWSQETKLVLNWGEGGVMENVRFELRKENWGGSVLESQNPKCQDLPKFQLIFGRGVFWRIWSKISGSLACLCITDSLSHTTYVETNEP